MLDKAGRKYGCGRLQYEYITETQIPFGSTEATMALPYWTDGCMDTIDGVLFESSTTTPFHFLDQAEYALPGESSNPVSFLNYPAFNLADGIKHLQFEGVRYFLAVSPEVEAAAKTVPGLVKIASTPGFPGAINQVTVRHPVWDLYLIKGAQLVTPLDHLPVVESGGSAKQWLNTNLTWWESEQYWPVELAAQRTAELAKSCQSAALVPPQMAVAVKPTTVTNVRTTNSTVSFDVGRLGSPGARESALFPELACHRSARAIRGVAESHGSRADSTSRDAHLRHHDCGSARQARLARWRGRSRCADHDAPAAGATAGGALDSAGAPTGPAEAEPAVALPT